MNKNNLPEVQIIDDKIINFEELLQNATWLFQPNDEWIICKSMRSTPCYLPVEYSLWKVDLPNKYDPLSEKWIKNDNRYFKKFYGDVILLQIARCKSPNHELIILPSKDSILSIIANMKYCEWPSKKMPDHYFQKMQLNYGYDPHIQKKLTFKIKYE